MFGVADYESSQNLPIQNDRSDMAVKYMIFLNFDNFTLKFLGTVTLGISYQKFEVANYESAVRISKFKMVDKLINFMSF